MSTFHEIGTREQRKSRLPWGSAKFQSSHSPEIPGTGILGSQPRNLDYSLLVPQFLCVCSPRFYLREKKILLKDLGLVFISKKD